MKIIPTVLLIGLLIFGSVTIYYRYAHPEYFICSYDAQPTGELFPAYETGTIFKKEWIAPSCEDGVYAYTIPIFGKLYKYQNSLGLLLILIAGLHYAKTRISSTLAKNRSRKLISTQN
jgi:hypothetical protein